MALAWLDGVNLCHLTSRFRAHSIDKYTSLGDADKGNWTDAMKTLTTVFEPESSKQLHTGQYCNR